MADIVVLYTTWPDAEMAEACAAEAVAERLAACANIGAPVRSVYRWQGAVERCAEVPMLLKTTAEAAPALVAFIVSRHSFQTPCVVAMPVDRAASLDEFLAWVEDEVTAPAPETISDEPISPQTEQN